MRDRRTLEQNKRFHAMVRDIAQQVEWAGEKMDEEDWKRLLLASAYGQKVVPNPFGGNFVVVNIKRSSELPQSGDVSMASLITQILAFGNERGVRWTDPEWQAYLAEVEGRN